MAAIQRALAWYNLHLLQRPYAAHMLTAGALWWTGDAVSQRLQGNKSFEWKRSAIMTGFGFFGAGPAYAFWYSLLDRQLTHRFFTKPLHQAKLHSSLVHLTPHYLKWKIALIKLAADFLLFDPPFLTFFFFYTHLASGHTLEETRDKMKRDILPTYWVDLQVWTPIQIVNFRYVPVAWQPVLVNVCNVGWNAYLSRVSSDIE